MNNRYVTTEKKRTKTNVFDQVTFQLISKCIVSYSFNFVNKKKKDDGRKVRKTNLHRKRKFMKT